MAAELIVISSMQEIENMVQLFFLNAELKRVKARPDPILSKFQELENIEIDDEKSILLDSTKNSNIPSEPNISKVCRNCGNPYKTRFFKVEFCSLKCKKDFPI